MSNHEKRLEQLEKDNKWLWIVALLNGVAVLGHLVFGWLP